MFVRNVKAVGIRTENTRQRFHKGIQFRHLEKISETLRSSIRVKIHSPRIHRKPLAYDHHHNLSTLTYAYTVWASALCGESVNPLRWGNEIVRAKRFANTFVPPPFKIIIVLAPHVLLPSISDEYRRIFQPRLLWVRLVRSKETMCPMQIVVR